MIRHTVVAHADGTYDVLAVCPSCGHHHVASTTTLDAAMNVGRGLMLLSDLATAHLNVDPDSGRLDLELSDTGGHVVVSVEQLGTTVAYLNQYVERRI